MKEGKDIKTFAKIRVGKTVLPKFTEIYIALYGDARLVPLWGAQTWRTETEKSVTEFCYEFIPRGNH